MSLRVLTLNLWNVNAPFQERMDLLRGWMEATKPDLVTFQEVSLVERRPQVERVLEGLGYEIHYRIAGEWLGRAEGLAVATRPMSDLLDAVPLPLAPDDMPRILLLVRVRSYDGHGTLLLANTHLAFRPKNEAGRLEQIEDSLRFIAAARLQGEPVIFCGDFNEAPGDGRVYDRILADDLGFHDACDGWVGEATFSSLNPWAARDLVPGRRIDYIFASAELSVEACEMVLRGDASGPVVSDHYGLLAEFSWR